MRPNWFIGLCIEPGTWFDSQVGSPPPGVRRFHPVDLHITVAFLGAVGEARARSAWELASDWPDAPRAITLGDVIPMGPRQRPSAYSATVREGNTALCDAMTRLRGPMLAAACTRPARYPPLPHITLARPKRRATDAQRAHALTWASHIDVGDVPLPLTQIALYTWSRHRADHLFEVVVRHTW